MSIIYDKASAERRTKQEAVRRNLGAEVRGVESGRRCRWDAQRRAYLVHSDTRAHLNYELRVSAQQDPSHDDLLVISCVPCPTSKRGTLPAGTLGCAHRGLVARRLERMGVACFDGVKWRVRPEIVDLAERLAEQEDESE